MPFDFNIYSSLLLPFFIHAVVFATFFGLKSKKNEETSHLIMGLLLLVFGLKIAYWMLGFAGWYDGHDIFSSIMFYFPFDGMILIGPLLYYYFLSATNPNFKWKKADLKHFIIPILWYGSFLIKFAIDFQFSYPFPNDDVHHYGTKGPLANIHFNHLAGTISYASFFFYALLIYKKYENFQAYLSAHFTNLENISFHWLRNILIMISSGILIFLAIDFFSLWYDGNVYKLQWFAYFAFGMIIYYVSISAFQFNDNLLTSLLLKENQGSDNLEELESEIVPEANKQNQRTEKEENGEFLVMADHLKMIMKEQKIYLNPDISLSDLSAATAIPIHTLSRLINENFKVNFNDFINGYRVEFVKRKIQLGEAQNKTLLSLAFESGFNSKATFNRAFKKHTGSTPKDFFTSKQE